jgi:hypothetical protein
MLRRRSVAYGDWFPLRQIVILNGAAARQSGSELRRKGRAPPRSEESVFALPKLLGKRILRFAAAYRGIELL